MNSPYNVIVDAADRAGFLQGKSLEAKMNFMSGMLCGITYSTSHAAQATVLAGGIMDATPLDIPLVMDMFAEEIGKVIDV